MIYHDNIPELVADIMNWQGIKYLPVEDVKGRLTGLISYKILLNYYSKKSKEKKSKDVAVKELMESDPMVVKPEATVVDALRLMKRNKVDCLPVVKNKKLIGVITEGNFLNITTTILNNIAKKESTAK